MYGVDLVRQTQSRSVMVRTTWHISTPHWWLGWFNARHLVEGLQVTECLSPKISNWMKYNSAAAQDYKTWTFDGATVWGSLLSRSFCHSLSAINQNQAFWNHPFFFFMTSFCHCLDRMSSRSLASKAFSASSCINLRARSLYSDATIGCSISKARKLLCLCATPGFSARKSAYADILALRLWDLNNDVPHCCTWFLNETGFRSSNRRWNMKPLTFSFDSN